jgi:REP element-mobilizing transposase RayT
MSKGWHSRGYLPHLDSAEIVQHVVFRLADAVPPGHAVDETTLDAGHGASVLRDPICAHIVSNALLSFDGERYVLKAWCVMPNHVHALVFTKRECPIGGVVRSWKTYTAREINQCIGRSGQLWARDYFDRYMRDDALFLTTKRYIEMNPVAAGLCAKPSDWRYSSAGWCK